MKLNALQVAMQEKTERIQSLLLEIEKEVESLGLSFQYEIVNGAAVSKRNPRDYWKEVRQIAQDRGITFKEARDYYKRQQADQKAVAEPLAKQIDLGKSKRMSRGQKRYWNRVRRIAHDRGITIPEARQALRNSQAA